MLVASGDTAGQGRTRAHTVLVRDGKPSEVDGMTWAHSEDLREAWRAQARHADSGESWFLVAVLDGQVVGKAVVDWTRSSDGSAWLWMFSVHPVLRSRGIGRRILAEAEARAARRGCLAVELAVDDDNPRARDLYERERSAVVGPHLDVCDVVGPTGERVRVASPGVRLRKLL